MVGFAKESSAWQYQTAEDDRTAIDDLFEEEQHVNEKRRSTSASRYAVGEQQCHVSP